VPLHIPSRHAINYDPTLIWLEKQLRWWVLGHHSRFLGGSSPPARFAGLQQVAVWAASRVAAQPTRGLSSGSTSTQVIY
jgi:hypothetical protein